MFLKFENEQLVKEMASSREENLSKALIINRFSEIFCQNSNCSYNNYNKELLCILYLKLPHKNSL